MLFRSLTYNTNKLYRDLCARAYYSMGGTASFGVDQIATIFSELRLLSRAQLNIFRLREPDMTATAGVGMNSLDDLADRVRAATRRSNGMLLTEKAMLKAVGDEALAKPNPRVIIPVVVIGIKEDELLWFKEAREGRSIVVPVDDVTDMEKTVKEAFKQLKQKIGRASCRERV